MEEIKQRIIALEKENAELKQQLEARPKKTCFYMQQFVSHLVGYTLYTKGNVNKRLAFRRLDGESNIVLEAYVFESNNPFDISVVNKEGVSIVSISSTINSKSFMNCAGDS